MSPFDAILVVLCSVAGFTLQGAVGFGMGMLGSPLLLLIDSRFVPGPILASTMVFTGLLTLRERRAIDFGGVRWAMAGRFVGTFPAVAVLALVPAEQLSLVFGTVVLLAVVISVSGFLVSRRIASRLDRGYTRRAVLAVASVAGLIVIGRYFAS
jgi:hypothetical protein